MLAPTGFWIPAGAQYIVATGGCPRQDQALPLSRAPPSSDEGVKSRRGHPPTARNIGQNTQPCWRGRRLKPKHLAEMCNIVEKHYLCEMCHLKVTQRHTTEV